MTFIIEYPEFVLAILAAFTLLLRSLSDTHTIRHGYMNAAMSLVEKLPVKYVVFLRQINRWSGSDDYAGFCGKKLYFALAALILSCLISPLLALALGLIAFFIPDLIAMSTAKKRQREILAALPQALDLMVLCIDAGLGLDSALQRVANENDVLSGALNQELALLNRDILLGIEREHAYIELFERSGVDELKTLGSALNQSSKLGLSIGKVIRAQGEFVRMRQQQKAEEHAGKISIWMVFPLWFCVMPALMTVVLAPSLIMFFKTVSHFPPQWFM